jgi:hypothetical protein
MSSPFEQGDAEHVDDRGIRFIIRRLLHPVDADAADDSQAHAGKRRSRTLKTSFSASC